MRVIPKITRIAIGRVLVRLAVIIGAFITIILHRVDAESLPEGPINIEVYCVANSSPSRRIRNAGPEIDGGNIRPGVIGPLDILASLRQSYKGMSGGLKFRA